jgi:hypothetical protein
VVDHEEGILVLSAERLPTPPQRPPTRTRTSSGANMDLNRNQFFFLGLVVLLIGLQVRCVSSYVLNGKTTQFLAERTGNGPSPVTASFMSMSGSGPQKVIEPPEWLGWCLMSVGAVLVLHSLAMKKPGG